MPDSQVGRCVAMIGNALLVHLFAPTRSAGRINAPTTRHGGAGGDKPPTKLEPISVLRGCCTATTDVWMDEGKTVLLVHFKIFVSVSCALVALSQGAGNQINFLNSEAYLCTL